MPEQRGICLSCGKSEPRLVRKRHERLARFVEADVTVGAQPEQQELSAARVILARSVGIQRRVLSAPFEN